MDTKKIGLYQHKHSAPYHIGIPEDGYKKVATMAFSDKHEDGKMGMEIVKRYNAYPEMIDLIGIIARNKTTSEAEGMDLGNDDAMDSLIAIARRIMKQTEEAAAPTQPVARHRYCEELCRRWNAHPALVNACKDALRDITQTLNYDEGDPQTLATVKALEEAIANEPMDSTPDDGNTYTVIVAYNDESGSTYMTTVCADDPEEACDTARMECAESYLTSCGAEPEEDETFHDMQLNQAMEYTVIACIAGEHDDIKP